MQSTEPNNSTAPSPHRIHVVAAVIRDSKTPPKILISKRLKDAHQGGLWEFPGGKVDAAEMPYNALQRELKEELGIELTRAQPLMQLHHDYSDKQIFLDIWTVTDFAGQARGMEGQECRWVSLEDLLSASTNYQFPEANKPVLEKLRLLMDKPL